MRIAFYAPMKSPAHPLPSGDRRMARLLIEALRRGGHTVEPVSTFSSFDAAGDTSRQRRLADVGIRLAARLSHRLLDRPPARRPEVWLTYHVYHKAPDWLGPTVSRRLAIPYAIAEASHAPKQASGRWATGHRAAAEAIAAADLVFGLNPADTECVLPLIADPARLVALRPFIDTAPHAAAAAARERCRQALERGYGIGAQTAVLLTVAMMRRGDKLASYRVLGRALSRLLARPWCLVVAGDGPARRDVARALAPLGGRVVWLGRVAETALPGLYAGADLFVWPAVGEAWGMVFLEAQASGLPVIGGRTGGVPDVVADGETGLLVEIGDDAAFAAAVGTLLDDAEARRRMGVRARERIERRHDLPGAARVLGEALVSLVAGRRSAGSPG